MGHASGLHLWLENASVLFGVNSRALRALYETFKKLFSFMVEQLNNSPIVGGCGADVELGEVSFRTVGRLGGIVWLRQLGVVEQGVAPATSVPCDRGGPEWRRSRDEGGTAARVRRARAG